MQVAKDGTRPLPDCRRVESIDSSQSGADIRAVKVALQALVPSSQYSGLHFPATAGYKRFWPTQKGRSKRWGRASSVSLEGTIVLVGVAMMMHEPLLYLFPTAPCQSVPSKICYIALDISHDRRTSA